MLRRFFRKNSEKQENTCSDDRDLRREEQKYAMNPQKDR